MAGKFKGNLAALARLQGSGLSECVDKCGKILAAVMEYVAVCEMAYPVRCYGYGPGLILELDPLLQHLRLEYVLCT